MMGSLPAISDGNCSYAKGFIEGFQKYICLNKDVSGFQSPMKKIALVLMLMQGPEVEGWMANMGAVISLIPSYSILKPVILGVTSLGAACRAGAHVSCATGQESVCLSEVGVWSSPLCLI
jgi:hypothetical protein